MKQVLEQYAQAVIAVVIALVIVAVLYGLQIQGDKGLSRVLGSVLEKEIVDNTEHYENTAFDAFHNVYTPSITIKNHYALEAGKRIFPEECFLAVDENKKEIAVKVVDAWNVAGAKVELQLAEDGSFCFERSGAYWISLFAKDERGYERNVLLKLFVNGGANG